MFRPCPKLFGRRSLKPVGVRPFSLAFAELGHARAEAGSHLDSDQLGIIRCRPCESGTYRPAPRRPEGTEGTVEEFGTGWFGDVALVSEGFGGFRRVGGGRMGRGCSGGF